MKLLWISLFFGIVYAADWTYDGATGVDNWPNRTNTSCNGQRQSPIDIPWNLQYMAYANFSMQGYDNMQAYNLTVKNNGHSAQIDINAGLGSTNISGGGLNGTYVAVQLHFHWGSNDDEGSEHTFRGQKYPLELHIVHFKQSYGTFTEALKYGDGLAVLGFFFTTEDAEDNLDLKPLIDALPNIQYKDTSTPITIDFTDIIPPSQTEFYRYLGSLTTPECREVVIWTVFENINTISSAQLDKFRKLSEYTQADAAHGQHYIEHNYRPVQALGSRTVTKNFQSDVPKSWHWSYEGHEGPEYWKNYYQTCSGDRQSPIDIPVVDKLAPYDASLMLESLSFTNYDKTVNGTIKNNGHAIQIDLTGSTFYLEHGGLGGRYVAAQFHFHWGPTNNEGSEHTYQGKSFPLELHIVHYKESYGSLAGAVTHDDGLAVVGFFFEVGAENAKYSTIINAIDSVKYIDSSAPITGFSLLDITHKDLNISNTAGVHLPFYRYMGGLTTPPCSEVVTWTVMHNRIVVSSTQLAKFRSVSHLSTGPIGDHDHIEENYRPTQELKTRKVYQSFDFKSLSSGTSKLLSSTLSIMAASLLYLLVR